MYLVSTTVPLKKKYTWLHPQYQKNSANSLPQYRPTVKNNWRVGADEAPACLCMVKKRRGVGMICMSAWWW